MSTRRSAAVLMLLLVTACAQDPATTAPTAETTEQASPTDAETGSPTPTPSPSPAESPSQIEPTDPATESPSPESSPSRSAAPRRPGTRIVAAPSDFGRVLFDRSGQAIYIFDVETTSRPRCYRACAEAWPPVLTDGSPTAGQGVRGALLGTTKRTDGTTQVTYDGQPLYFYAHEGKNEVQCHDVFLDGGNWYAVQPNGRRAP